MNPETPAEGLKKATGWSMISGILMFVLFAGASHLTFAFHSHSVGGFLWKLLLAVVYGVAGIYLLANPLLGVVSLTLVLAGFLFMEASWK